MKKKTTIALAACIIIAALSSCGKSGGASPDTQGYTCECTIGQGGGVSGTAHTTTTQTFAYGSISQSDAKSKCDAQQTSMAHTYGIATAANGYNGVYCALK